MTSDEADQGIILSRRTLACYFQMTKTQQWPLADLALFRDEIGVLEAISEAHPGKTAKRIVLVGEWVRLRERVVSNCITLVVRRRRSDA